MATRNPRRTLISDSEIDRVFAALRRNDIDVTRFGIDIRMDGIAFLPPTPATLAAPEKPFDAWKQEDQQREDQNRDRRPRRS